MPHLGHYDWKNVLRWKLKFLNFVVYGVEIGFFKAPQLIP